MSQRYALVIGNSAYDDETLRQLRAPQIDVLSLANALQNIDVGSFDKVDTLIDKDWAEVQSALADFFAEKKPDDLLLVYFSGHGVLDEQGRLYLAMSNTKRYRLSGSAVSSRFITDEMDSSRSRKQILILDCCHSGAFSRGTKGVTGNIAVNSFTFEGEGHGRVVLTATDAIQQAWEGDQIIGDAENSLFTHFLVEGILTGNADKDNDGQITLDELYKYTFERISNTTNKQRPKMWTYSQEGGQLVIAKSKKPQRFESPVVENLINLENEIHNHVVGQDQAIETISKVLRRAYAGFHENDRPIGSFIFLGPSGTGKSLLARSLAKIIFGNEKMLIEIDASEYMERHTVSRLVGAPPGYVGYEEGGQLTEAVRRQPQSVLLFDGIEKAHPEVHNLIQSILGNGYCNDAMGRRIDFSKTIIVMTSSIGTDIIKKMSSMDFSQKKDYQVSANENLAYDEMKNKLMEGLKRAFRPEFINRVDVVVFSILTRDQICAIIDLEIAKVNNILEKTNAMISLTDEARNYLAEKSFDEAKGAWQVKQVIREHIQDRLVTEMLNDRISNASKIQVDLDKDNQLVFERV
jgi:AAA domain (Cdc48 subfamily)/Caspase domain/C-terminal, D2-small domain, of ClpB protein